MDNDGYPDEDYHRRHSDSFREYSMPLVQEISVWHPTTLFDKVCVRAYSFIEDGAGLAFALVTTLVGIVLGLSVLFGLALNPLVGIFTVLSVIPAFFVAWYFWEADPTPKEPALGLGITFLFAGFAVGIALVVNTLTRPLFSAVPVVGTVLFFYMVVAPVEETAKWLAIRVHAYRRDYFDTAVAGAVYGAFAGLGFATFENLLYLVTDASFGLRATAETSIGRAAVAPGHVLWSSIAGYYLGLARTSPSHKGAIALKGLVVAGLLHGTYNVAVTYGPAAVQVEFEAPGPRGVGIFVFLVVFYGLTAYYLVSKVERHRELYASFFSRE